MGEDLAQGYEESLKVESKKAFAHLVSALSLEPWDLANSVEMYSVLLSHETFFACCLALWNKQER